MNIWITAILVYILTSMVRSNTVGQPCPENINNCFYPDSCVDNIPTGGHICICRLTHIYPNLTYSSNFTNCDIRYGPWGTYPIENGEKVEEPLFQYERIPDEAFTSSGHYQEFLPNYARIKTNEHQKGAWCAPTDSNQYWLQIDLGDKNEVYAVSTQARAGVNVVFSVKTYKLGYSDDGTSFTKVKNQDNQDLILTGNEVMDVEVINFLDPHLNTRYLRFHPLEYLSMRCMRIEIYGFKQINECENGWNQCDAKATCTDTISAYYCTCPAGYRDVLGNGFFCLQVNECRSRRPEFRHNCSTFSDCADTDGAFTCTCHEGYQGDGYYCEDIDECEDGTYTCLPNLAYCVNKAGGYDCACNIGYTGDGLTKCDDENECKKGHDCHKQAKCINTEGSFKCVCRLGFVGDGRHCVDVDECKYDPPLCHKDAKCTNTIGSFICTCNDGFRGSGRWCDDIDECAFLGAKALCKPEERCFNYPGGHVCMCPSIMPVQRPYKELERTILDQVLSDFRDTSKEDWKYPLDYHAHLIRIIYQLIMKTYDYHYKEVPYSFFMEKVAGNDFAVESYDVRCTDIANVSFPNFCHDGYKNTEFPLFTDVVDMWLIEDAIEPFENWATPPPVIAPDLNAPTTTSLPLLTEGPLTTRIVDVNGTNVTFTEAPRTTPKPFRNCGGSFSGNTGGDFYSPNYPDNYPPNARCVWTITAPEFHSAYVRFYFFQLEHVRKCFYDYVEIRDESEDGEVLARYCGEQFTLPIRSGKRRLVIIFISDNYYEFKGFHARWEVLSSRTSLTCITYNQMSTMPASYKKIWKQEIEEERDKSTFVPISRLLACRQYPRCNHTRPGDVISTLEHFRDDRNIKICVHWMLDQIGTTWTTRPCKILKTNKTHTICSCHTWGIVAVLGKYEKWEPYRKPVLFMLGRNSFLSILFVTLALVFTFFYLFLKDQWGAVIIEVFRMKEFDSGRIIQMHIVLNTLLAEIFFSIITFNITPSVGLCFIMSFVFYYLLQTVFFWLFIYTIFLQARVKEVFDSEKYNSYKIYIFVGYLVPFVVTLTISGLNFKEIINENVCWLLFYGNTVWAFSGVIVTLGVGSLALLLKIIYSAKDMENGIILQEKCVRTIFTTFFVLLTAVFGARALQERSFFAEYVFSLCNLLQGFSIAVMYCVLQREDPIIRANQVGPIRDNVGDEKKYDDEDKDEDFKDMESDEYYTSEEEEDNGQNTKPEPEVEQKQEKKYKHVRDGSAIFLQLRSPNDLDDDTEEIEMQERAPDEEDCVDGSSDDNSDGEIMFRFDELKSLQQQVPY